MGYRIYSHVDSLSAPSDPAPSLCPMVYLGSQKFVSDEVLTYATPVGLTCLPHFHHMQASVRQQLYRDR